MNNPLSIRSFPKAIVHFDGDAFFASVEQARNWKLRGKPVATGGERNIIASMSYEAKRRGVTRAMTIKDAKAVCPDLVMLRSDYELYSLYARRMYTIVRRFTSAVEEYSIDECFADITGLRAYHHMSYEKITALIKDTLEQELNVTFGAGLGPNKSIAKIASKWQKPAGLTVIPGRKIHEYLGQIPIGKIWGIGFSTAEMLRKRGVQTALDFALKSEAWLDEYRIAKPYKEIWHEFHGRFAKEINADPHSDIASVVVSRTFTPPSKDRSFILSELSKNIEGACHKLRFHGMRSDSMLFKLKTQNFTYVSHSVSLAVPTSTPGDFINLMQRVFDKIFDPGAEYRASGVSFHHLSPEDGSQLSLFDSDSEEHMKSRESVFTTIDTINHKLGTQAIYLASSAKSLEFRKSRKESGQPRMLELPFLGNTI
ncbi:MAG TPA: DNA polymerase IV [Candidatus Paceibacterota bacterium]|nr:DNA polymerase IV [Candidatus Paceibacterota bacterium]